MAERFRSMLIFAFVYFWVVASVVSSLEMSLKGVLIVISFDAMNILGSAMTNELLYGV